MLAVDAGMVQSFGLVSVKVISGCSRVVDAGGGVGVSLMLVFRLLTGWLVFAGEGCWLLLVMDSESSCSVSISMVWSRLMLVSAVVVSNNSSGEGVARAPRYFWEPLPLRATSWIPYLASGEGGWGCHVTLTSSVT